MSLATVLGGGIVKSAGEVLDNLITSDEERGHIEIEKLKIELAPVLKEMDERIAQAQHPSLFVAGGRPFVIWATGAGVAFNVICVGLLNWAGAMWGGPEYIPLDRLDWTELGVLAGLAGGTGFVRHLDKVKGVARDNLKG